MSLISVIIPVYNVERYLDRCITSVIKQDLSDLEIIICNDASIDASADIIKKYMEIDSRIKLITHKENQGLSISRNDGIEAASGEYIFFLDSDDYIGENVLTTIYKKTKAVNADVLYFGYEQYSEGNQHNKIKCSHESIYPKVKKGYEFFCKAINRKNAHVASWGAIYRNKFLKENNIKFKPYIIYEDILFYYEVLMKARIVTSVDDYCYEYIRRENSLSTSQNNNYEKMWSCCSIIAEIISIYHQVNISEFKQCTNDFIAALTGKLIKHYKRIDFFDRCKTQFTEDEELIFSVATGTLYNGFFRYKLPEIILERIRGGVKRL